MRLEKIEQERLEDLARQERERQRKIQEEKER
jgi:hypothetical protein